MTCWLARYSDRPCDGRLTKAHLISKQVIRREVLGRSTKRSRGYKGPELEPVLWDPRIWVPACILHHNALDSSRRLRIPREALPAGVEEYAEENGLLWWLEREYGALVVA